MRRVDDGAHGRVPVVAEWLDADVAELRKPFGFAFRLGGRRVFRHARKDRRQAHETAAGDVHVPRDGEKRKKCVPDLQRVGILVYSQPHRER